MSNVFRSQAEFDRELCKLPPIEEYKANLQALFELDKTGFSVQQIKAAFFDRAILQPFNYSEIPVESISLIRIFRVRLNIREDIEDIRLIRTFSYPPPSLCRDNGRANLKQKTVFYCADNYGTSIAESKPRIGDSAYLSIWKINCNRTVLYTSYAPVDLPETNQWKQIAKIQKEQIIAHSTKYGGKKSDHLIALTDFIAEVFVKEKQPYALSSWFSDEILYGHDEIDFIAYPSFATDNTSNNMAFHPNFVEQYFLLEKVFKLRITDLNLHACKFELEKVGIMHQTTVIWNNPIEEDHMWFEKTKKPRLSQL